MEKNITKLVIDREYKGIHIKMDNGKEQKSCFSDYTVLLKKDNLYNIIASTQKGDITVDPWEENVRTMLLEVRGGRIILPTSWMKNVELFRNEKTAEQYYKENNKDVIYIPEQSIRIEASQYYTKIVSPDGDCCVKAYVKK